MKKIFEYSYQSFLSDYGTVCIERDGSVYKESVKHSFSESVIPVVETKNLVFKSPDMVEKIIEVIKKRNEILSKIPKGFNNPGVLDGARESLVLGHWHYKGSNIIQCESVSELNFESVLELDEYMRGDFYSAELQKVFREVKSIIDSYNKTETILWQFEEPPAYLKKYEFEIDELFPEEELKKRTYRIGEIMPFDDFFDGDKKPILTKIKKRVKEWDIDIFFSSKHSGCFTVHKGGYQIANYKYKGKIIPILYCVEDVDESSITVKLCAIEKEYLNRYKNFLKKTMKGGSKWMLP